MKKTQNDNQRKFVIKTVIISAVLLLIVAVFTVAAVKTWPQRTLRRIDRLIANEEYIIAESLIEKYESKTEDADMEYEKLVCGYNIAVDLIEQGKTEDARYRLEQMEEYEDAKELLKECDYIDAVNFLKEGFYGDAYALFANLDGYKDAGEKILEARYFIGLETYENGNIAEAFEIFAGLGEYKGSQDMADKIAMEVTGADTVSQAYSLIEGMNAQQMAKIASLTAVREALPENVLSVGARHTVGLKKDGTVLASGSNEFGQCDVDEWENITAIDAGYYHTIALTEEGKVLAAGSNEYGQCDVVEWENITAIAAGAYTTYALTNDGQVLTAGFSNQNTFEDLDDVKYIGAGAYAAVCILKDGRIIASHQSMYLSETGAISADVNTGYIVALMPEGIVTASKEYTDNWEDVISLSAGSNVILGITADGKANAYFFDRRDQVDLSEYTNVLAVAAGGPHSALLLEGGRVIAFGSNEYGQCDVDEWDLMN